MRLEKLGRDRLDIIRMLASTLVEQASDTINDDASYDLDRHLHELSALPDSWDERMRDALEE